jgi:hypothetical protein
MAVRPSLNNPAIGFYSLMPSPSHIPPQHRQPLHASIPLPAVHDHGDRCHTTLISLHPILQCSSTRTVAFDLHHHPQPFTTIPSHALTEPATNPPLPCLSISTRYLHSSIVVLPSQHPFVTVSDVFHTLHHTLSLGASQDELCGLPSDIRPHVHAVYERRVQAHADWRSSEWERQCGIRKIDLFLGRTRFLGVSMTANQRNVRLILDVC